MKILYFDCFSGISGDMILGALVDAGLPIASLEAELAGLNLPGLAMFAGKVLKNGLAGTKVTVHVDDTVGRRRLRDIREIIAPSGLPEPVKGASLRVYQTLAEAEARIHHASPEDVHFHEVGALDAIADIVGAVAGLRLLGIDRVVSSPVHLGSGFIECRHGRITLPAPATIEILKGVPVYSTGLEGELITPTGAALLKTLAEAFGPMPPLKLEAVGYGAGTRDLPIANHLRVIIGRSFDNDSGKMD